MRRLRGGGGVLVDGLNNSHCATLLLVGLSVCVCSVKGFGQYKLRIQHDQDGNIDGLVVDLFAHHPPVLQSFLLDFDDENSSSSLSEPQSSFLPVYFGNQRFDLSLDEYTTKQSNSLGLGQDSLFWWQVESMLLHKNYLWVGKRDRCLERLRALTGVRQTGSLQCKKRSMDERKAAMCTVAGGRLVVEMFEGSHNNQTDISTEVVFLTNRLQLPKSIESQLRVGFIRSIEENTPAPVLELTLKTTTDADIRLQCGSDCYTRQGNPFDRATISAEFLDEERVGLHPAFWRHHVALLFDARYQEMNIVETTHWSLTMESLLNVCLVLLSVVLLYRLTHRHRITATNESPLQQVTRGSWGIKILARSSQVGGVALAITSWSLTAVSWEQLLTGAYVTCTVILCILFDEHIHAWTFSTTGSKSNILLYQAITDLYTQSLLSVSLSISNALVVTSLVTFHLILLWDMLFGTLAYALFEGSRHRSASGRYTILSIVSLNTVGLTAINVFYYLQNTSIALLSTYYGVTAESVFVWTYTLMIVGASVSIRLASVKTITEKGVADTRQGTREGDKQRLRRRRLRTAKK